MFWLLTLTWYSRSLRTGSLNSVHHWSGRAAGGGDGILIAFGDGGRRTLVVGADRTPGEQRGDGHGHQGAGGTAN